MSENRDIWRKQHFEKVRDEIRTELDAVALSGPDGKRLHHALYRITECQQDSNAENQLKQYIYAMSALVEHSRYPQLGSQTVKQLLQLAESILRIQKLPMKSERHAFLYGDLYLVQSQIHRVEGLFVQALWEEQISNSLSQKASPARIAFQNLSTGIHLLRMGYAFLAVEEFKKVDVAQLTQAQKTRWMIEHHMALRLAYRLEEASQFAIEANNSIQATDPKVQLEWRWEELCRESQKTGNIDVLMRAALPKKDFAQPPYGIEAFLLARIVSQKDWMERFTTLPNSKKSLGPELKQCEVFWKAALVIRSAYNPDLEYVSKLHDMGKMLSTLNNVRSIYHELLIRASLVRWIIRRPSLVFGKVAIVEYQTLCMRLSGGKTHDVLSLLKDVPFSFDTQEIPEVKAA